MAIPTNFLLYSSSQRARVDADPRASVLPYQIVDSRGDTVDVLPCSEVPKD